jgi:hypothetical protein
MTSESIAIPRRTAHVSARPFLAACVLLLLLLELFGYLYLRNPARSNDFRAFYSGGYLLRTQPSQLYDLSRQAAVQDAWVSHNGVLMPFYHPSYEALLFAPLSLLPFRVAYAVFMALMVLCLVGSFYALRSLFSIRIPLIQVRPGMMIVCFVPVLASIAWGQDSLLFLLVVCVTIKCLHRDDDFSAGCILALGLFRFQLAIPLAILLAVNRSWRFVAGFLSTAAAVLVLSLRLVGSSGVSSWAHLLVAASLVGNQDSYIQQFLRVRPVYMPNLAGLLYALGTKHLAPHTAFAAVLLTSMCAFIWTIFQIRRQSSRDVALAMALLCTVLISYHILPYDLGILLPVLALSASHVRSSLLFALYWLPLLYSIPLAMLLICLGIGKDSRSSNIRLQ